MFPKQDAVVISDSSTCTNATDGDIQCSSNGRDMFEPNVPVSALNLGIPGFDFNSIQLHNEDIQFSNTSQCKDQT